jgi:hypothetical protein
MPNLGVTNSARETALQTRDTPCAKRGAPTRRDNSSPSNVGRIQTTAKRRPSVADSSSEIGQNRAHAHASRENPRHQDHNLPENLPEKVNGLPACVKCGAPLVLKPVPGAKNFPLRLECPEHGWQPEELRPIRMRFHKDRPDW